MNERLESNSRLFLAAAGLLEVVVACIVVVGLFAAASQPFGWSSALQFLTCAVLGGLLWYADRGLDVEAPPAPEHARDRRTPVCR